MDESLHLVDDSVHSQSLETNPRPGEYFGDVLRRAIKRRALLKGAGATGAVLVVTPAVTKPRQAEARGWGKDPSYRLTFDTVPPGNNTDIAVPNGYDYNVIIRWGDPVVKGAPELDVDNQTPEAQAQQFGFNADLVLWYPLPSWVRNAVKRYGQPGKFVDTFLGGLNPKLASSFSQRALMVVNHEYTSGTQMFRSYTTIVGDPTEEQRTQREVEIQSHGFAVIEIKRRQNGTWYHVKSSPFNRRITGTTEHLLTGPIAGTSYLKTAADPTGRKVLGCFNNCAGGKTPWGTVLTCEENFDQYFANFAASSDPNKRFSERIAAEDGSTDRQWELIDSRFDLGGDNINEYNRFGYVVELDPYDPDDVPKKHTALGRFKHEGAATVIAPDGRAVVYSGDDANFEYVYKFVSKNKYDKWDRKRNKRLLEKGMLYVARFDSGDDQTDEMGRGEWLSLVWESGNGLHRAGFQNQAEVLLNARGAADVLGATPMDRPEDIEASPKSGHVFITLTNNSRRTVPDEPNPRAPNPHGHLLELIEDDDDSTATTFRWNVFVKCGNPTVPEDDTKFGDIEDPAGDGVSPISDPDNIAFDDDGNLWIATDGQFFSRSAGFGQNDGVFAVPIEGKNRGLLRQFLSGVPGCEICGPEFSGDNRTFFCAVQHPHDSDVGGGTAFEPKDRDGNPIPRWPVGEPDVSRPSLVAVYHKQGAKIGR